MMFDAVLWSLDPDSYRHPEHAEHNDLLFRSATPPALFEGLFQGFEKCRVSFRDGTQSGKADHPVSVDEE